MDKYLILQFFFNIFFIYIINSVNAESINDLLPYQLIKENDKDLKLKIVLDSVRLKLTDSLLLECPIDRLKPATFMFLRKDAVDFITRFSIQLNDTFNGIKKKKKKKASNLSKFLNKNVTFGDSFEDKKTKPDKILLNCKWLSSDLNNEYGNLTLFLNKPNDNQELNKHLLKFFTPQVNSKPPEIIKSANKIFKRELGDKISFYCNVNQPQVKINWFKKDEDGFINLNDELITNKNGLDISNYRITSNRLTIKELQESDFAEYMCKASNDYGDDYISYKLESMTSKQILKPKIDSIESVYLKENRSVLLNCSITSYGKFGVQWFERVNCKKFDCNDPEIDYYFIENNEYYKPMISSNSALINQNKIQYSATYHLPNSMKQANKYICMVRNENGLNYKVITLSSTKSSIAASKSTNLDNNDLKLFIIILSGTVLIILSALILICILMRKSKKRTGVVKTIDSESADTSNNLNNNLSNRDRSQNDYLYVQASSRSKKVYDKSTMKNSTLLINNLVQTGRQFNGQDYSSQYLNKHNRSKISSISNSFQRLNNTPIDDTFSCQNI